MKKTTVTFAVIAALTLGALGTAQARERDRNPGAHKQKQSAMQHGAKPRNFQRAIDARQAQQRGRIKQGRRNGDLNRKQVARLRTDQKRIRKLERRFGADGRYTRNERRIIKHKLNHASQRIWRMKGRHQAPRHGYRQHTPRHGYRKHGQFYRGNHRSRAHHPHVRRIHRVYRVYPVSEPVYEDAPTRSLGLEVETEQFRFSINKSG